MTHYPGQLRTIALDFDGTLLDTHAPWLAAYRQSSGHLLFPEDILDWHIEPFLLDGWAERFVAMRTPGLYLASRPLPGAQLAVWRLAQQGHRLICITADEDSRFARVKRAQLARFFPSVTELVVAKNKRCVRWDILVDDGLHNNPTLLVPSPWNGVPSDTSWAIQQARFWTELPGRISCC